MDDDATPGRHARRSRRRLVRALAMLSVLAVVVAVRALGDGDPGPLAHAMLLVAMLLAAQALWIEQQLVFPARGPAVADRLTPAADRLTPAPDES